MTMAARNEKRILAKGIKVKLVPGTEAIAKANEDLKMEYNMYMLTNNYGVRNNLLVK